MNTGAVRVMTGIEAMNAVLIFIGLCLLSAVVAAVIEEVRRFFSKEEGN